MSSALYTFCGEKGNAPVGNVISGESPELLGRQDSGKGRPHPRRQDAAPIMNMLPESTDPVPFPLPAVSLADLRAGNRPFGGSVGVVFSVPAIVAQGNGVGHSAKSTARLPGVKRALHSGQKKTAPGSDTRGGPLCSTSLTAGTPPQVRGGYAVSPGESSAPIRAAYSAGPVDGDGRVGAHPDLFERGEGEAPLASFGQDAGKKLGEDQGHL